MPRRRLAEGAPGQLGCGDRYKIQLAYAQSVLEEEDMKRLSVVVVVVLVMSGLLSACGGSGAAGGPVGAVQGWLAAWTKFDSTAIGELTCADLKPQIDEALSLFNSGSSGQDLSALKDLFSFDFSKLTFEEKSNDGKTATVHVAGAMSVKALGQEQSQDMNEDVQVVNEGGNWKVCSNALSGAP